MNSIQKVITKNSIIAEINLVIFHPNTHKCILVKGPNDVNFMHRSIDRKIPVLESPTGKSGVIDIFKIISNPNLICICDRDYDVVIPGVLYYDFCTLETMLFSIDDIVNDIFDILNIPANNMMLDEVKKIAAFLGGIRKYAYLNGISLNFDKINPDNYYKNNLDECKNSILSLLEKYNDGIIIDKSDIDNLVQQEYDVLNIINGHDLIGILCNRICNQRKISPEELERYFVLASTKEHIKNTTFFNLINEKIVN